MKNKHNEKPIHELTNEEANQELHEGPLVDVCWHKWIQGQSSGTAENNTLATLCHHCGVELNKSTYNPDYCKSWDAVIPVIQALDWKKYGWELFGLFKKKNELDGREDLVIVHTFKDYAKTKRISKSLHLNVLLAREMVSIPREWVNALLHIGRS